MSDQFFIPIPQFVAKRSDLTPAGKCVFGSIFMRASGRGHTEAIIKAEWICQDWAIDKNTVTRAIHDLEAIGAITVRRTMSGNVYRVPMTELPQEHGRKEVKAIPQNEESDSSKCGIRIPQNADSEFLKMRKAIPQNEECINTRLILKQNSQTESINQDCEPFESPGTQLPNLQRSILTIPDVVKGLAEALGAQNWLNMQIRYGTPSDDWRILETLRRVKQRADKTKQTYNGQYLTTVFLSIKDEDKERLTTKAVTETTGMWPEHLWSDTYKGWSSSEEILAYQRKKLQIPYKRGPQLEAAP